MFYEEFRKRLMAIIGCIEKISKKEETDLTISRGKYLL